MGFNNLGNLLTTRGVQNLIEDDKNFYLFVIKSLSRYQECDWGDLCKEDKKLNDLAVKNGDDRILAKYCYNDEVSIYIITEWDRSATTILFPSEY